LPHDALRGTATEQMQCCCHAVSQSILMLADLMTRAHLATSS
jgi:hypothetical protein